MADFNSVLNRLKKLKDSTDIDEKVGSFARGLTNATMQGYRQPVNNFRNNVSATRNFVSNLNPNKPIADPIPRPQGFYRPTPYQTPLHLKLGANLQSGIQSLAGDPRTGAKGNPYQGPLKVFEPIERGQKAILRRTLNKGLQRAGDRPIAGRVQQASEDVLGPKQSLGRDATDVLSMGATMAGLASPLASAGYTAFGTAIRGASNKLQGGKFTDNLASNINQSFVEGVPMAGVGNFTNPVIERAAGGLSLVPRLATKGALNMGEGVLMDRAAGFETTKESLLIDALMPAGFELSGTTSKAIAKAFKRGGDEGVKMFDEAIKGKKVNKDAIKPIKEYIQNRDKLGRFTSKNAVKVETKPVKEELRKMPDGSYRTFRDGKMATWFGEDKFKQLPDGRVVYKNPQNLMGGIAGVEIQRDDEGKPVGVKYNPVKGAIGVGAMAGYTKVKGSDDLKGILNYQDRLVKSGVPLDEAEKISYKQYQKMQAEGKLSNLLDNVPAEADNSIKSTKRAKVIETDTLTPDGPIDIPTNSGFKAEINKIFNPIKNAPAQVQSEVKNWSSKVMTGRARASEVVNRFSNIDEADGWKFIQKFQDPNAKVDLGGKYEKEMVDLRNYYNSIREEGIRRGLDINYLDNYLNQVWKNPPEEVDKALAEYMKQGKSLGKNPSFTKKRVFDTYSDGIKYGLKPKYTHPGQLAAHYRYQLDKAIANRDLVNNLKRLGAIVPSNEAPAGWKTVDTQLIPDIDGFRAEPSVAKSLNNLFSLDKGNAFLRAGANASRYAQQVSLSGGIPGTPMNAFTLGNMIKEVTGGRVKSPVKSFVYAMSDSATKDYFKKNEKYATMMAQEGIRSRAITDYDKAYKNLLDYDGVKGRGQAIADLWNSAMEKPTFERFMPMLELNTFKDTYEEAIKNGVSSKEARRVAGETTKAWHGVADKLSRSTDVDNTLSAVFFAPTFRESMINFWGANAKAMNPRNWADHKYKYNKKFLGGMLVTYVLYNLVNKALTGHYLHENKDGKEFAIEIPRENGRSWFIPMLPSIGTLPRRGLEIAGALKGGDIKTAAQKFGSFFSQPINVGGSLLSNRTFYGGPIYTDEDTAGQKVGKLVGYGAEQLAHPYIGEPIAYMQGRKTPIEALMGAMELPVYPSKSTYASHLVGGQNTKFNSIVKASDDLGKQYAEGVKIKNALTSDKPTKKQLKVLNSVTPDKLDGIALAFGYDNYLGEKPAGDLEYKAYSNEVLSDARSVYNDEEIPESIKKPLIERMGQSYKDVELDAIAQKSVVDKAIYVRDELAKLETPQEKQQFLNDLYHNKTLSDKRIFTDSVAEELGIEDAYKIAQRYSKAKSGSSKKIKLGTTPTFKAPKVSPIKVSATKRAESKPIKLDLKGYSGAGKNTSPIKLGRSKSLDSAIIKLRNLSN